MDMDMPMGGATDNLNDTGIDFSNSTQAATFLGEILDDSVFQIDGNTYARNFWFGICAAIAVGAFFNFAQKGTAILRYVLPFREAMTWF